MRIMLKGIDVSKWQGTINWSKVKAEGIKFAIIRLGYGSSRGNTITVDSCYHANMHGALKAGLSVGVYFYSYAKTAVAAKREAHLVVKQLKKYHGKIGYPIWFDIEDKNQLKASKFERTKMCEVFCKVLEEAGYYAGVYASKDWFTNKLGGLETYDKWVAQYNDKCTYAGAHGMWQYSSTGKVNGIKNVVDMNYSYNDYPNIMRANKLNGVR